MAFLEYWRSTAMPSGAASLPESASTLAAQLWPTGPRARHAALRAATLMIAGTVLLTVSAKIQVPFWPVPMTMQTLVVLMIGAAYGWRLGGATVALYLVEGAVGLPVFAGTPERGLGLPYMMGPTGGFLIGFLAAAVATGWLAERGWDKPLWRLFAMMAVGHAVIFAFGLGWLAALVGWSKAWAGGAAPFMAATLLKTALAAALMQAGWTFARR
jgi:biotin transport system substrate-specific component